MSDIPGQPGSPAFLRGVSSQLPGSSLIDISHFPDSGLGSGVFVFVRELINGRITILRSSKTVSLDLPGPRPTATATAPLLVR